MQSIDSHRYTWIAVQKNELNDKNEYDNCMHWPWYCGCCYAECIPDNGDRPSYCQVSDDEPAGV